MNQTTFLDAFDRAIASARHSDPATSHEAAAKVEASGRAGSDRSRILAEVRAQPGMTAGEIADIYSLNISRHDASKRLAELRHAGLVKNGPARICKVHSTRMMTWLPV